MRRAERQPSRCRSRRPPLADADTSAIFSDLELTKALVLSLRVVCEPAPGLPAPIRLFEPAAPPADSPHDARGDCAARDRPPKRHYEQAKAVTRPGPPAARVATSTSTWYIFYRGRLWEFWPPGRRHVTVDAKSRAAQHADTLRTAVVEPSRPRPSAARAATSTST